jgi:hypothetical protein
MFRQGFTCPALLKDPLRASAYGAITRSGRPFQTVLLTHKKPLAYSGFARHYFRNLG